ncbi:unnamed protein product [Peniophora sp. CBMAI 1063]|nr:unnamed protein product [Peniophora sp. CBMAI 1063]
MFPTARLTAFLALVIAAAASPIVTIDEPVVKLPLSKHFNGTNFAATDRARVEHLISRGKSSNGALASVGSAPVTNQAVIYTAALEVGTQTFDVIVDTGSSNTWVGAVTKYKAGSTSTNTGKSVSVSYGSGSFSGTEYTDTVTLGSLTVTKQSIGVASRSTGFSPYDGILGIGPTDLTEGTVSGVSSVPTFTDNLYSQGTIPVDSVAVSFEPTTTSSVENGELTFGGVDSSKYSGSITYTATTSTSPASYYWGIDQTITYGTSTSILSNNAGIVDTGTTLIYIATDAYNKYVSATGAKLDSSTGLLTVTATQYAALKSLYFTIGGTKFELTANAQLWPRSLNSDIGGSSGKYYLVVADIGTNSGEGLDFINGYTFLERFYTVYDTTNSRFGIATTPYTTATTN